MTDEQVKDFEAINFSECFESKKKIFSKLNEEQNLRKVAKLPYIFLTILDKVEKYVKLSYSDICIIAITLRLSIILIQDYNLIISNQWL